MCTSRLILISITSVHCVKHFTQLNLSENFCFGAHRYNEGLELGTCDLLEASGSEWAFNNGSWQTYWKMQAKTECGTENCELCDEKDVCIKCAMNAAKKKPYVKKWDKENKTVVCS